MQDIKLNYSGLEGYISEYDYKNMQPRINLAHEKIKNKSGEGSSMLGFLDYADKITDEEINKIKNLANKIKQQADVFIVIGIGGSYLGSKAIIDIFSDTFSNYKTVEERKHPQIIFAGNSLSGKYLRNLIEYIEDKDVAINVISKSGTTLEPSIAFRILKTFLEEKYGKEDAKRRIYVTTDEKYSILKKQANEYEYETLVIPDDIGGRFSVLTPVGLLPMAVANIKFEDLLDGAMFAKHLYDSPDILQNDCYKYAAIRNILYEKGKDIEVFATYEPSFSYFIEWFKQLFGESEGKDGKAIFPAGVTYTTDLHSMGQLIQQGRRNIFETVLIINKNRSFIKLPESEDNMDNLNYLALKEIDYINKQAFLGTLKAHTSGNVPNTVIEIEDINEYSIGQLIFFFEKACAISAYVLGVNPFNQPGVEDYKKNMMDLLKE